MPVPPRGEAVVVNAVAANHVVARRGLRTVVEMDSPAGIVIDIAALDEVVRRR